MAQLGASNMNMNMNMNMGAGLGLPSVAPAQTRFNTADYRKLAPNAPPPFLAANPMPTFPVNWDPDLRSYLYLNDFVGSTGWFGALQPVAAAFGLPTAPGNIQNELQQVLDAAPDREDRFAEIIQQHDAEGAISYFLGMLMIDPARHPNTYLLIRVARRIGELITMVLKGSFMVPRPSQVCPAVVPMIDPPVTPAFPAGHSLQAHLIAMSLKDAWAQGPGRVFRITLLDYLSHRIGENRVIAGVHYPRDDAAGRQVAVVAYPLLKARVLFANLVAAAQAESV